MPIVSRIEHLTDWNGDLLPGHSATPAIVGRHKASHANIESITIISEILDTAIWYQNEVCTIAVPFSLIGFIDQTAELIRTHTLIVLA